MTPQNRKPQKEEKAADDVVRLEDLVPRDDVKGGAKLRFGESTAKKPRGNAPWEADLPGRETQSISDSQ